MTTCDHCQAETYKRLPDGWTTAVIEFVWMKGFRKVQLTETLCPACTSRALEWMKKGEHHGKGKEQGVSDC